VAKLSDLSVSFLSLVGKPATGKTFVLRSIKPGERVREFELVVTMTGISLAGVARVEAEPSDDPQRYLEKVREALAPLFGNAFKTRAKSAQLETDMTDEELRAVVKKEMAEALKGGVGDIVKAAIDDALKKSEDGKGGGEMAALKKSLEEQIAKATAPGDTETDVQKSEGSFL